MSHLGHDVTMLSSEGPGDFTPARKFLTENTDLDQMYRRALTQSVTAPHVTSRNMYPPRTADMVSQNNALHNYAWEETGFPQAYVDAFNESLQFLTVTAEHVKKILIDNGVKVPIAVVGNGVDHWLYVQADPDYMLEAGKVRLLHVSSCFPRKGADVLLESYGRAFTADDDVTLIIKTFDNPHNTVDQMLAEARKRFPNYPSVLVIKEDYTAEQLKALYEHCHILVAPSRAEGFGLPMAEAMLSGLHVITTGWSGQLDFCDPGQCDLIDFSFAHASTHEGVASSVWVDPDPEHLATLMKQVSSKCSMPGAVRPEPAPKLLSDFTWDAVARRNVQAARQLTANRSMTQPRIGWISTYNTRCGIATYSEHLVSVLGLPVTVLATRSDSKVRDDEHYVKRMWSEGQEHGQDDLLETIEALDLDVVVVQFNYGFFDFEKLNRMLHTLN
ncbi:MAG: glycosyltransferase, partial [Alcaligenaceae bacterium]